MHVFFEFLDDLVSPFATKGIYLINRPKVVYEHAYQVFLYGFFEAVLHRSFLRLFSEFSVGVSIGFFEQV